MPDGRLSRLVEALGAASLAVLLLREVEQRAGVEVALQRMAKRYFGMDGVVVASPDPRPVDVPGVDEVVDDRLDCSLGYAHTGSDVTQPRVGITRDAEKDLGVMGKECP